MLWIGLRPARGAPVVAVAGAVAIQRRGLVGDHQGQAGLRPWRHREITLVFDAERQAAEATLGRPVPPELLRRNLLVEGLRPVAWKRGQRLRLGTVLLQVTVEIPPCRRMDQALGPGARSALEGRGGLAARVLEGGAFRCGDRLLPV